MDAAKELGQDERQLVVFSLAGEAYGVDIERVQEIIRLQNITHVPRTPPYVNGVINLRGKIVPVVDLRRRLALPCSDLSEESRIVVVKVEESTIGMIVDAVNEVYRVDGSRIEPISPFIVSVNTDYLLGIVRSDDRLIVLIDLDAVFRADLQNSRAVI